MAIEVDLKCEVVGGSSTFLELTDTPSSYTGQAGKKVVVNGDEDALEFVEDSSGGGVYSGLGEWSYNSTPGTPNAGEFSFNNANPQLANKLYISYTDANSLNKIFSLTFFNGVDYKVAFSGTEDGSKFYSCAITLVGFTGTYLELDIAPYDSYNLVDGDKLGLFIQSSSGSNTALEPGDPITLLNNNAGYITASTLDGKRNKISFSTETANFAPIGESDNSYINVDNSSDVTVTFNSGAFENDGDVVYFEQIDSGRILFANGTATINASPQLSLVSGGIGSIVAVIRKSATSYTLTGITE